jgi:hypothetical protein
MELRVNDYVRTKYGEICKLKKSRFEDLVYETDIEIDRCNDRDCNDYGFDSNTIQDIIKSSPNIIDLIEVGDYVNSKRVEWVGYDIYKENEDKILTGIGEKRILFNEFTKDSVRKNGIKTIVTKEQFQSMEYKVKE